MFVRLVRSGRASDLEGMLAMGLENPIHIAILLMVVLLVFGAKRLPEMGHSLGSGLRGFKDALSGEAHSSAVASQQLPEQSVGVAPAAPLPSSVKTQP
jgi:sec-independent protein translocase protein TatA